jgi:hypothetical protein
MQDQSHTYLRVSHKDCQLCKIPRNTSFWTEVWYTVNCEHIEKEAAVVSTLCFEVTGFKHEEWFHEMFVSFFSPSMETSGQYLKFCHNLFFTSILIYYLLMNLVFGCCGDPGDEVTILTWESYHVCVCLILCDAKPQTWGGG